MNYRPYQLQCAAAYNAMVRQVPKNQRKRFESELRKNKIAPFIAGASSLFSLQDSTYMAQNIVLEELCYYDSSRPVLFVKDQATLDFIMGINVKGFSDLEDFKVVLPYPPIMSVVLPSGAAYKGVPMHSFLFGRAPIGNRLMVGKKYLKTDLEMKEGSRAGNLFIHVRTEEDLSRGAVSRSSFEKDAEIVDSIYNQEFFDTHRIPERDSHERSILASIMGIPEKEVDRLSVDSQREIRLCLQLGLSICLYSMCFPGAFSQGVPEGIVQHEKIHCKPINLKNNFFLGCPDIPKEHQDRHGVRVHVRSPTLRILGHKRFHRDEKGNVRVIPVKGCIVGGGMPYTVSK